MKHLPILLFLLCAGCVTTPIYHRVYEYDIPAHKLIVCDQFTLDHLFPKPLIYGKCFTNGVKKIYCVGKKGHPEQPDGDVRWHEDKHFIYGDFHK